MPVSLTIHDETLSGDIKNSFTLDDLNERLTVKELIRSRVYQEVNDHNQTKKNRKLFSGLVRPTPTEENLNKTKKEFKKIDWEEQFDKACEAFEKNGFFILIDNHQAESLEQTFLIKPDMSISFVKLVALVGG